jgi:hypothetical protein
MAQGDVLADFDQYYATETKVNLAFAGQGLHLQLHAFTFGIRARITSSNNQRCYMLPTHKPLWLRRAQHKTKTAVEE